MNKAITITLIISVAVVILASLFASGHPDGLEWVAERLGFIDAGGETPGIMPDYSVPGIRGEGPSTIAAGLIGAALAFSVFWAASMIGKNRA